MLGVLGDAVVDPLGDVEVEVDPQGIGIQEELKLKDFGVQTFLYVFHAYLG